MHFKARKMAVLQILGRQAERIGIKELLNQLGDGYAERSVRRWLDELVNEGVVEKKGNKRGTRYQAVLEFSLNEEETSFSSCFEPVSQNILKKVSRPLYERMPVAYADEWFDSYQPNKSFYLPSGLRSQLYRAGKRSKKEDPAGTYAHQIFNRLLIDLSYNSSRLEGNTYSLLDTQKLVLEGSSASDKLDEEKVMILNHKEAIRYLVDNAPRLRVNSQTVCMLHYLLSEGLVEEHYAGKIRDHGVWIGGSTYMPFEDPRQLQMRLAQITKKAELIEDPYEQSLFLLIHVTYLQAFTDVNKRTARLSANIPLIQHNLVPLSFNGIEKEDYTSAVIAIYELQEIRPLLDLYVFSYMRTCAQYDSTVKSMGFDAVRVLYRAQRRAFIREIILKKLTGRALQDYCSSIPASIDEKDRESFLEDLREDLKEIDQSRLVGLGVTLDELHSWQAIVHKEKLEI